MLSSEETQASIDSYLTRLENIANSFNSTKRWFRIFAGVGLFVTTLAVVAALYANNASENAKRLAYAVDLDRRTQGLSTCERENRLQERIKALGTANQERWEEVTAVLDLTPRPEDTPARRDHKIQLKMVLDREAIKGQAALNAIQPIDCANVVPPANGDRK